METGFDNIFGEGPTPSHSAMAGERDMQQAIRIKIKTTKVEIQNYNNQK